MLTKPDVQEILDEVEYLSPAGVRIVRWEMDRGGAIAFRCFHFGADALGRNHPSQKWPGRWWLIDPETHERDDVLRTLFAAIGMHEEHIRRERFKYQGTVPFNPHRPLGV